MISPNGVYPYRLTLGATITPYVVQPSTVQLFRFSAVTWNAHRIHYDARYARSEGYPDVLVQSHLHGCYLANAVLAWAGRGARLRKLQWRNRALAVAGDTLTVIGVVVGMDGHVVEIDLQERNDRGDLCAPGRAVVELPTKAAKP